MVERCIKFNCKIIRFQKVGIISLITRITTYNLYYSYISNRLQELFPNYFPMNLYFRIIHSTLVYSNLNYPFYILMKSIHVVFYIFQKTFHIT